MKDDTVQKVLTNKNTQFYLILTMKISAPDIYF